MKVLMAASEAVPLAKTGGLADVAGALPGVLQAAGADVTVVLPAYRAINRERFGLQPAGWSITVPVGNREVSVEILTTKLAGAVPVYLPCADAYFDRDGLYGTAAGDFLDNAERFAFFARAVLAIAAHLGAPAVLHCHDWQTALAPAFLRADAARYPTLAATKTVLTIHNLAYQGLFWNADWHLLILDRRYYNPEQLEFYGKINYLKAGMVFADALTTVSRKYAEEIQTEEFGHGLAGVLRARRRALTGILNGVDYREWSPEHDPHIAARYSANDLAGKAACKADLQRLFGLPVEPKRPLLGIVSRLAAQKGFDLLAEALPVLLRRKLQLVVLGSGDAQYQDLLAALGRRFAKQVGVRIAFDNTIAHQIEAGADMFLMPSRYEPCGLNQIYSLRYGTIPVVRATGGLDDTISEFEPAAGTGTGFKFSDYSVPALLDCLGRALSCYRRPAQWRILMQNAMAADFSWARSAQQYLQLYRGLLGR
ncbi:MAG: glycogen synthase GlgA [Deltaproteobacteria bacterium]|nr:glycogen synthase GlgA [Deltaproteobacteria bacterium]